jgi:hypothetical protein
MAQSHPLNSEEPYEVEFRLDDLRMRDRLSHPVVPARFIVHFDAFGEKASPIHPARNAPARITRT